MCYNFATFVLYLDVITLIYRENRLTSSETCLSANKGVNQQAMRFTPFIIPKKFLGISTDPLFLHSTRVLLLTLKKRQRLPPGAAVVVIEMK